MSVPDDLLADRYRLVRFIAAGGMGVVWEGWDELLERSVAVKMLRTQAGVTDAEATLAKSRAMREARIAARLHHPNAVPVFDVVELDGQPCLIMQFLQSTALSEMLQQRGRIPSAEVAHIGAEIASALAAAHKLRIVHRDVKPGNILIADDDGRAMITDFGISRAAGDSTLTGVGLMHGTPAYLAPEIARGGKTSYASDVFSLGSTLYAALEGAPPFGTDLNPIAVLHRVASGVFEPLESADDLSALVVDMLRANPDARPSMKQVAGRLAALAAGYVAPDDTQPMTVPIPPIAPPVPTDSAGLPATAGMSDAHEPAIDPALAAPDPDEPSDTAIAASAAVGASFLEPDDLPPVGRGADQRATQLLSADDTPTAMLPSDRAATAFLPTAAPEPEVSAAEIDLAAHANAEPGVDTELISAEERVGGGTAAFPTAAGPTALMPTDDVLTEAMVAEGDPDRVAGAPTAAAAVPSTEGAASGQSGADWFAGLFDTEEAAAPQEPEPELEPEPEPEPAPEPEAEPAPQPIPAVIIPAAVVPAAVAFSTAAASARAAEPAYDQGPPAPDRPDRRRAERKSQAAQAGTLTRSVEGGTTERSRKRLVPLLMVAAAVLVIGVIAAFVLSQLGGATGSQAEPGPARSAGPSPGVQASSPPTSSTPAPAATAAPIPEQTPPAAAPPASNPVSNPVADPDPNDPAQLVAAVNDYYALMPGNRDAAWPRMTVDYQTNHAGGRDGYESFWGDIDEVEAEDVTARAPGGAEATLRYHFTDGHVEVERTSFGFVEEDGILKIASTQVLSSG